MLLPHPNGLSFQHAAFYTMNFGAFIYGTLHVDIAIVGIEHR